MDVRDLLIDRLFVLDSLNERLDIIEELQSIVCRGELFFLVDALKDPVRLFTHVKGEVVVLEEAGEFIRERIDLREDGFEGLRS